MRIVIDTNIFISALIKENLTREMIINSNDTFIFPEYEFQEIYKHKEDIQKKSGYSEIEFIKMTSFLLKNMKIVTYEEICNYYNEAYEIMNKIDSDDKIFIATALAFDAIIWSDDKHFKMQDRVKSLTTEEMKNYSN
ncbi:MAG: putative toxin-antitoxin system toxin component, PIN family [Nanoarchaeota archaeon]